MYVCLGFEIYFIFLAFLHLQGQVDDTNDQTGLILMNIGHIDYVHGVQRLGPPCSLF